MSQLRVWQRIAYFAGEALLIGGALWGLWARFLGGLCPSGMLGLWSPFGLVISGVGLANLGLHPFGRAPYLLGVFQRVRPLSIALWILGLAGVGYALYARQSFGGGVWWLAALVPAVVYQLLAVQPRADDKLKPAATAPPPPPKPGGAGDPHGGTGAHAREGMAGEGAHPTKPMAGETPTPLPDEEGRDG